MAPSYITYWPILGIVYYILLYLVIIYGFVLFVRLSYYGIKALKIYISKNKPDNK